MDYPDFSSIFPTPNTNYPCTFNPNPGFTADCIGKSQPTRSSSTPSSTLSPISNTFSLYKWALPITIPSLVTTEDTTSGGASPDKDVLGYWIQAPYVPSETYSDMYPDPDPSHKNQPFAWTGFNQALSKCIELDGSTYPKSNNICSSSNTAKNCIDPKLAFPNKKPSCYAVVTQSDYTGIKATDTKSYSLNYFLVEQPNTSPRTSVTEMNKIIGPKGKGWVDSNPMDSNYLFCQTQFYTWIKNTPSGAPYAPANSANPNFSISSCPGPKYKSHDKYIPPDNSNVLNPPPSFFNSDPNWEKKLPSSGYVAPPSASTSSTTYIIGGVVLAIILVFLYFTFGPGAESDSDSSSSSKKHVKKAVKVIKKLGGYFNYGL